MKNRDILIETLADNEHARWASWQRYLLSKCIKNKDGSLTIPKELVEYWEYEINIKYKDLPDRIKERDRREVKQILELIKKTIKNNPYLKSKSEEVQQCKNTKEQ